MPPRFALLSLPFERRRPSAAAAEASNKLSFAFCALACGRGVGAIDCLSLSLSLALASADCCRSNSQHSCNFCGKQFHGSDLTSFASLPLALPLALALHIPPSIALFCLGQILMSLSVHPDPPICPYTLLLPDTLSVWRKSRVVQLMNMLSAGRGRWQMLSRAQFLIFWADTSLHRVCKCVCERVCV